MSQIALNVQTGCLMNAYHIFLKKYMIPNSNKNVEFTTLEK